MGARSPEQSNRGGAAIATIRGEASWMCAGAVKSPDGVLEVGWHPEAGRTSASVLY
jgi:hypothetical protein